jgi:hypothetical protein
MKNNELKKVLKPLIKECIKEVVFEEGILSGIISEVLKGTTPTVEKQQITEIKKPENTTNYKQVDNREDYNLKLRETKQKMLSAMGADAYNGMDLFEGTDPLKGAGTPGELRVSSPLDGYAPEDSGIDISAIFSSKWKSLV